MLFFEVAVGGSVLGPIDTGVVGGLTEGVAVSVCITVTVQCPE